MVYDAFETCHTRSLNVLTNIKFKMRTNKYFMFRRQINCCWTFSKLKCAWGFRCHLKLKLDLFLKWCWMNSLGLVCWCYLKLWNMLLSMSLVWFSSVNFSGLICLHKKKILINGQTKIGIYNDQLLRERVDVVLFQTKLDIT